MECYFEDLITQRFPIYIQPVVKEGLKWVKDNSTAISKQGAKQIISLHPTYHVDKVTNFTKFADFVHNANGKTKAKDITIAIEDHFNKCVGCDHQLNLANCIDDAPKMLERCRSALQNASNRMFVDNVKAQGAVIMMQYALLWYLWAQSKRTDKIIEQSQAKLEQINKEYIIPALQLLYVGVEYDKDDEKYTHGSRRPNISIEDSRTANVLLKCASDRLTDSMDALADQKQASYIHFVVGSISTVASLWFTGGLFSATRTLYSSPATYGTSLFMQQAAFTTFSAVATGGICWMTCKHLWNAQQCGEILNNMKQMKKQIDDERIKLNHLCVLQRER